ncbi:hypothetical protein H4219_003508, partial [Mycoemilia scoparia]
ARKVLEMLRPGYDVEAEWNSWVDSCLYSQVGDNTFDEYHYKGPLTITRMTTMMGEDGKCGGIGLARNDTTASPESGCGGNGADNNKLERGCTPSRSGASSSSSSSSNSNCCYPTTTLRPTGMFSAFQRYTPTSLRKLVLGIIVFMAWIPLTGALNPLFFSTQYFTKRLGRAEMGGFDQLNPIRWVSMALALTTIIASAVNVLAAVPELQFRRHLLVICLAVMSAASLINVAGEAVGSGTLSCCMGR